MTTTAFDDQFTVAPEPVRQTYDTCSILRRNVADLEIALRKQTERAEKAEAELAKLREQEPVAWMLECQQWTGDTAWLLSWSKSGNGQCNRLDGESHQRALYERPIPRERSDSIPAPAVPDDWREVMAELAADLQASIEAEHAYRDQYSSVMRKYQNDMRIVERARTLLQAIEVTK